MSDPGEDPRPHDRALIVDVLSRYAIAVDGRDADLLATCFATGATASYGPGHELVGREAIVGFIVRTLASFRRTQHLIGTHVFELAGDTAATTTYVQAAHVMDGGPTGERVVVVGGRYVDRFELEDARWVIASRRFEAIWTTEAPSSVLRV
jgi:hypothetical protein